MCPVCIATALVIAGSSASTGGLAAVAMKKLGLKKANDGSEAPAPSAEPGPKGELE